MVPFVKLVMPDTVMEDLDQEIGEGAFPHNEVEDPTCFNVDTHNLMDTTEDDVAFQDDQDQFKDIQTGIGPIAPASRIVVIRWHNQVMLRRRLNRAPSKTDVEDLSCLHIANSNHMDTADGTDVHQDDQNESKMIQKGTGQSLPRSRKIFIKGAKQTIRTRRLNRALLKTTDEDPACLNIDIAGLMAIAEGKDAHRHDQDQPKNDSRRYWSHIAYIKKGCH